MNRRTFLKSFGALAACAVTAPALAKLAQTDVDRLASMMQTGLVENQTFLFREPIVITFNNLTIRRCRLIFDVPYRMRAAITLAAHHVKLLDNFIDCGLNGGDCGIEIIEPGCPYDMTETIQSGINATISGYSGAPVVFLKAGTYPITSRVI